VESGKFNLGKKNAKNSLVSSCKVFIHVGLTNYPRLHHTTLTHERRESKIMKSSLTHLRTPEPRSLKPQSADPLKSLTKSNFKLCSLTIRLSLARAIETKQTSSKNTKSSWLDSSIVKEISQKQQKISTA
jgi:hypothetical protein